MYICDRCNKDIAVTSEDPVVVNRHGKFHFRCMRAINQERERAEGNSTEPDAEQTDKVASEIARNPHLYDAVGRRLPKSKIADSTITLDAVNPNWEPEPNHCAPLSVTEKEK